MTHINLILEPSSERRLVYYPGEVVKGNSDDINHLVAN